MTSVWARQRLKSPASQFRRRSKKTSKLRITDHCDGHPPVTGGFPSQKANNAKKCFHLMTSSCLANESRQPPVEWRNAFINSTSIWRVLDARVGVSQSIPSLLMEYKDTYCLNVVFSTSAAGHRCRSLLSFDLSLYTTQNNISHMAKSWYMNSFRITDPFWGTTNQRRITRTQTSNLELWCFSGRS